MLTEIFKFEISVKLLSVIYVIEFLYDIACFLYMTCIHIVLHIIVTVNHCVYHYYIRNQKDHYVLLNAKIVSVVT